MTARPAPGRRAADPAGYDGLAAFYGRYWGARYHDAAEPVLERLAYADLPAGARVLDLCCGTGHLTSRLVRRGYVVAGVDGSLEMLREARRRTQGVPLWCADATALGSASAFDAVLCTFDSLNHVLAVEALVAVFASVARALRGGGRFVFDVNTTDAYRREWGKSSSEVSATEALFVRGGYDAGRRLGHTDLTLFWFDGAWQRRDLHMWQRPWDAPEIGAALDASGFSRMTLHEAPDAGMRGDIAIGRMFAVAMRE